MADLPSDKYSEELLAMAEELGIDDIENNDLITSFLANYDFYRTILEKALADGIISVDEKVELYKYRASIIADDFRSIAQKDELTKEDAIILQEIMRLVDKMRQDEEKFASMV